MGGGDTHAEQSNQSTADLTWPENSRSGLPKGALITESESDGESITLSGTVGTHYAESSR